MKNSFSKTCYKKYALVFLLVSTITNCALASGLPFDSTMKKLMDAICGPFLGYTCAILIVGSCMALAFGELSDGFKRLVTIAFWLSIAFGASLFISNLFGL